jgi:arylsulfatase A-like enzyme
MFHLTVLLQSIDFYPTFLDILSLKPAIDQKFDGISILPALQGKKLDRDTIFCHFPHNTNVGDDYKAGSWVRQGDWKLLRLYCKNSSFSFPDLRQLDWKLLRLYCKNSDLTDKYELYHLKEDISESHDLALEQPDRVTAMKKLLGHFLKETNAVIPEPNPNFGKVLKNRSNN